MVYRFATRRTDAPANPLGRAYELMVNHLSRIVGDTASRREASAKAYRYAYPLGHIPKSSICSKHL
jgi:hypothetical protein